MNIARAREIAEDVYEDRRDKMGYHEFEHVQAVAQSVSEQAKVVAWLHDTVEDGLVSWFQMYYELTQDEFEALLLLTRDKARGLSYMNYIRAIAQAEGQPGEIAREVKRADLKHNMSRPCPPEMTGMREPGGRYDRALEILG